MPTEHRPERREAGGGRECDGGAIMAPHFPTNSSGAYLFRWHGGGGVAAVAGGPKGTTREAGLLPPRTEKRRRSLTLPSSDFELWEARRGGGREGGRHEAGEGQ